MLTKLSGLAGLALFAWNTFAASLAVKVNQVGYLPDRPKLAMVTSTAATGAVSLKRTADNVTVWSGTLGSSIYDAHTNGTIRIADFSAYATPGNYYLSVAGVGDSYPFAIADDAYNQAFYTVMRGFYGMRCGTAVSLAPDWPEYQHTACHAASKAYHASTGKTGTKAVGKGWHDAGDYGKYTVNSAFATGLMLWAYEWHADRIGAMTLNIPETGSGIPDVLSEVKWNLEWLLAMQDTDGGVWIKVTTPGFAGAVMPQNDTATEYIVGKGSAPYKSTAATADFAAVMAIAARIYGQFPATSAFAADCLTAAQNAWTWVVANPNALFTANPGGSPTIYTGVYGDDSVGDEKLWAAAELFRTTGNSTYNTYFVNNYTAWYPAIVNYSVPWWGNARELAMWTYAFSGQPAANATAVNAIRTSTITAANDLLARAQTSGGSIGYRVPMRDWDYYWGGGTQGPCTYGMMLLAANAFQPTQAYVDQALENLHFLFGRNHFCTSWVTGLGSKRVLAPHHRPSMADGISAPWPGLMVFGPDGYNDDGSSLDAIPKTYPAARWVDDAASYVCNETTVGVNASLVFLLASAVNPASAPATPEIEASPTSIVVPEGSSATFQVRLTAAPAASVTVAVSRASGDADITVQSGSSLVFTTVNWNAWQTVTLAAAEDGDTSSGMASIACAATGLATIHVTATEADNDATLTVNAATGGTTTPSGSVIVTKGSATAIAATANAGYTFANWTVTSGSATFANATAASTTVTISADAAIRANFSLQGDAYTISTSAFPAYVPAASGTVNVNVGYTAATGCDLWVMFFDAASNWVGEGMVAVNAGSGTVAVPVWHVALTNGTQYRISSYLTPTGGNWNNAHVFGAEFWTTAGNPPPTTAVLTVNAATGGTTTPAGATTVNVGAATAIAATANTGYTFANWTVTSGSATFANANAASTTVTISADAAIRANFTAAQNQPPVVSAATCSPSPVTGTTGSLAATATDDGGEASLTYTWTVVTKPGTATTPTFSVNGTNAAKNCTVTFYQSGSYTLRVTAKDGGNLTATKDVTLTAAQTLSRITVSPASTTVRTRRTKQFTAVAYDQFNKTMTATFAWTVSGGGTISTSGLFTAGTVKGGPHTVTATTGGLSGTAQITVN